MESLHISFKRVVDAGMSNGIVFNSVMHLSHMFYADDAVFMGQWSTKNIDTIIYVLKCFYRASGLSINLSKSKLLGVVVSEDRVVQAANRIGCGVLKAPFAYLGSKVGGNMSRIKPWDEIVDKMFGHEMDSWVEAILDHKISPTVQKDGGKVTVVGIPLDPYMFEMITSSGDVADQIQKKQIHYLIKVIIALRPYDGNMHFFSNTLFFADRS
ncbi:hypothetical protein Tco_1483330 [Tanacetum coccineum]